MKAGKIVLIVVMGMLVASDAVFGEGRELWTNMSVFGRFLIAEDLDKNGVLEILCPMSRKTIFISGSKGKIVDENIEGYSKRSLIADIDGDGEFELILSAQRPLLDENGVILKRRGLLGWKQEECWTSKLAQVFTMYDFDGDGYGEIVALLYKKIVSIGPAGGWGWSKDVGPEALGILADVMGDDKPEIAVIRWVKSSKGYYSRTIAFEDYNYDFGLSVLDPATGDIISTNGKMRKPVRYPIAADLSDRGKDDVVVFTETKIFIVRDGNIYATYRHTANVDLEDVEVKSFIREKKMKIYVDDMGMAQVKADFLNGVVGNFHSSDGLEIAVITILGHLIALSAEGEFLWESQVGIGGEPVVADVNGDGDQEIILPLKSGEVTAFDGETGEEVYSFTTVVEPAKLLVADVNGDGNLDIVAGGNNGITAWTMDARGEIEWATEFGDATGTGNYGMSRGYTKRIADPYALRKFPYVRVGGSVAGVLIAIAGIFFGVRYFKTVKSTINGVETEGPIGRLEKAYERDSSSPNTVIPLAKEYAKNKAITIKAIEIYEKALKLAPKEADIITACSKAFVFRKILTPESEELFRAVLELNPDDNEFVKQLVGLYSLKNRTDNAALSIYHGYFTKGDFDPKLAKSVAEMLARAGSVDAFSAWLYHQVLSVDTGNIMLLMALLVCLKHQNDPKSYLAWATRYLGEQNLDMAKRMKIAEDLRDWGMEEEARRFQAGSVES